MLAGLLLLGSRQGLAGAAELAPTVPGESIYRSGLLPTGAPVHATRAVSGLALAGADAACVNCHRRSGLGAREGLSTVPPVTGDYLFSARGSAALEPMTHGTGNVLRSREAYTDATLIRAIRDGLDPHGRPLGALMPRYALPDSDMAALIAYLRSLGAPRTRGVTDSVLHFATVIAPDADPARRNGMLDVLRQYVLEKNSFPFGDGVPQHTAGGTIRRKEIPPGRRHWQLHVWELTGPPGQWRDELESDYAREPVLALLSGAGGRTWGPVHEFCESAQLPCLFPNVEVPAVEDGDFYSLYFSGGVALEAGLMAQRIRTLTRAPASASVVQVYRAGDSGAAGAQALAAALAGSNVQLRTEILPATGGGLVRALRGLSSTEAVVLWLRPDDLAALGQAPSRLPVVFLSGLMGGLEQAPLPASWRARSLMSYPFDLPERRLVRLDYPLGWFRLRRIPVVALQTQADTYLACGILTETLNQMVEIGDPAHLREVLQDSLEHRFLTGYYPRLALAEGQTFASKGGYLVGFGDPSGSRLVAAGDWTVP